LPDTFPGIRFNDAGVCNFCLDSQKKKEPPEKKTAYRLRFETLIKEYQGSSSYDVIMCYSGGKDSSYTLNLLREHYGLKILAMSFDNGFLSQQAIVNIRTIVEHLGVDHMFFKPRSDIFTKIVRHCAQHNIYPPKALERASAICTSCIGMVKYIALRLSLEKNIPFVAFGWSPGQAPISSSVMKTNPLIAKTMQKTLYDPLYQIVGDDIRPYFLEEKHFSGAYNFPYNVHPLAFLDYSEDEIFRTIAHIGWKAPEDVDANSTNCRLNSFANVIHKQQFGFHPYAFEMANLVREGYLDRAIALEKLNQQENPELVETIRKEIG
jgi:tRNA(Ile)-lysidine synthase TilS/MesJ